MPTRFGFAYLFFDVLLFLLGTNYQNNIILLLSYLLASLFITVMMHSFYNFSQLSFYSSAKQYTFDQQLAYFPIQIITKKTHYDINFQFNQQGNLSEKIKLDQCGLGENQVLLPVVASSRGVHNLGRVKVFSEYSFGFFISWALLDFSHQLVVYPQPKKLSNSKNYLTGEMDTEQSQSIHQPESIGIDDFGELKSYLPGESQARVAWKQLARGQGKLSKHYVNQEGGLRWLKLSDMPSHDLEIKLRYLCYLIIELGKSDYSFGLTLEENFKSVDSKLTADSSLTITPNTGLQHQQACLIALAKFSPNLAG